MWCASSSETAGAKIASIWFVNSTLRNSPTVQEGYLRKATLGSILSTKISI